VTGSAREKDLVPVAKKLLAGDSPAAVEELASLLVGVVSGHPLMGAIGGRLAKALTHGLANGFVEDATKRMLAAGQEWDDDEAQAAWVRQQLAASIEPLLSERDDKDDERFLQTLRYIERNVASADAMNEVRTELRRIADTMSRTAASSNQSKPSKPSVAPEAVAGAVEAASINPKELRDWMAAKISPEELELFVADALPEAKGLRHIVAAVHPHEYQVFKVIEFCTRRGLYDQLRAALVKKLGPPSARTSRR